jgi:glucose-6-phosphate isomerase
VEEGKKATFALLGREGYEEKRAELEKGLNKKKEYIL